MMKELEKFKKIFEGLDSAYGITKKSDQFDERGKNKTESFTIHKAPIDQNWKDHLEGKYPGLAIIPINKENKCKWGCIDIDKYPFDHKTFIKKLSDKKIKMIVFRSKSGGAHAFLFSKTFIPAIIMRAKLKMVASAMGYAKSEIYPKQDYIRVDRGDTGSFLNLPYHSNQRTVRYAFNSKGIGMDLNEFFDFYDSMSMTEEEIKNLVVEDEKEKINYFKGMPPCLVSLLTDGVPNGQRNNCMYNVGVYLKKRYPEKDEWHSHMFTYNTQFMQPPLDTPEINTLIESVTSKEYHYKCKDEPINSFCNAKKCMTREFGIGDDAPVPEMSEIRKYDSDPPIYFVSIGGDSVEVDDATLHDPDKFSLACMNQMGKPMMPVPKHSWRKLLIKLFDNLKIVPAPSSSKIDVQLTEILADYINKTPGKELKDVMRGIAFTDKGGTSYFKFKNFWRFLLRTKSWPDKTYPKQKTLRLMQGLFGVEEIWKKIPKNTRVMSMKTIKLERPNVRINAKEKEPWE